MAKYIVTNENKALIVDRLKKFGIPYWALAEQMGVHENTLAKMMRRPNDEQAEAINQAIDEIINDRE